MGVPGFYSWLTRRYPMIKHMINYESLPAMDYLYLDMNGIIYKCVRDDSIIFKSQIQPKQLEQIWTEIFNYINLIVELLKPRKMIVMALDGVAPRCKMNNQRARRFRSAQDYKEYIGKLQGYTQKQQSEENFKNNSISPGTSFMHQLNSMLHFFIQKKIQEDDYWKSLSIVFTGSDTPGEGEHKIMQFVRSNSHQFLPQDAHCFYGADADLIMLGLTLPIKNACIIREQYIVSGEKVQIMSSRKGKQVNFELIYLSILKQCFDIEYQSLKNDMKIEYNIDKIARDFVFLFFFIGNDFLPRIYAYNIRERSIDKLIDGFKQFLKIADAYITDGEDLNLTQLLKLLSEVAKYEESFFEAKQLQFDSFLNKQQKNFEDELQRNFASKIKRQQQTLLSLKQMYSNLDGSGKLNFYKNYFGVDPAEQPEAVWSILNYYVYGLKFVFQYYFKKLASWSWYYPHYFAPLLTDIQYFIGCILAQDSKLTKFAEDSPFEPFKQLLCILPKESADLLPPNFNWLLNTPESPLRTPVDYYPDHIQSIPYGSTRAHEAISLIPYLDQATIYQAYDKQIEKTSQADLERNKLHQSRLYEYNFDNKPSDVESPFPTIDKFQSKANITKIDLFNQFKWKTSDIKQIVAPGQQKLLRMPSLHMRDVQIKYVRETSMRVILRERKDSKYKLGSVIYYGYPNEHSCQILGILTMRDFLCSKDLDFKLFPFLSNTEFTVETAQQQPKNLFLMIKDNITRSRFKSSFYECVDISNTETFFFIADTRTFIRTIQGQFQHIYKDNFADNYSIIPASVTSQEKIYQTTRVNHKFSSLQEEFLQNEEVLVCHPEDRLCGAKGKVIGYTDKKVRVQIIENPHFSTKEEKQTIIDILSTQNEIYFSLRFAAEIVGLKADQLIHLLSSVNVITPKDSKLPPSIDIGLNFINRREKMIVPNLVRINFRFDRQKKEQNPFKHIELSIRAVELLLAYKKKFPQIIKFIAARFIKLIAQFKERGDYKIDWDEPIKADQIYPNEPAKGLMRVYLWLIQREETHMPVSSIYSKKVSTKRIQQLRQYFEARKQKAAHNKNKNKEKEEYIIDPNFLFSHRLSQLGQLYLKQKPQQHQVGDIVISISPQFFGHYGAIIGIDDNKFQVHFQRPSFGKNDLGGLCQNLWGGRFQARQILNVEIWPKYFVERQKPKQPRQKLGWVQGSDYFYPLYKGKPLSDFNDVQGFLVHEQTKKVFSQQLIQQIRAVQTNLKQSQIDASYTVVDNNRQDHRYKFNKKVMYVQKQQIKETVESIKATEQKIEAAKVALEKAKQDVKFRKIDNNDVAQTDRQVIENKVEEGETPVIVGEEQDADDIFA